MRIGDPPPTSMATVRQAVRTGLAELIADPDLPGAWTLYMNGVAQSHVDTADPTLIAFDYVRRMVDVIEALAPAGPLEVLHLGAGAMTLPRCLAVTRPGSLQRVIEVDAELLELIQTRLPLDEGSLIEAIVGDAAEELDAIPPDSYDVVVADVFQGAKVPAQIRTAEFAANAAAVVRGTGCYVANIMDGPVLDFAKAQAALLREVFAQVAIVADAAVLRGRRHGNLLLVGTGEGVRMPALVRRLASDPFATRVEFGERLDRFLR